MSNNKQNLVDLRTRDPEERKRISKMGWEASARKRKEEKNLREWAKIIGGIKTNVALPDGTLCKDATLDADLIMQQYRKAHAGDTKAARFIAELKGELIQQVDLGESRVVVVESSEQAEKLANIADLDV